jgi:hypothetical protein
LFTVVDLAALAFPGPRTRIVVVEDLLKTEAPKTKLGPCQVGSETDRPCPRQAVVEIRGIPFCEQCAREQESYFAIGELTQQEEALGLRDELLIEEILDRMRWERTGCSSVVEMVKAKVTVESPE